MKIILLLTMLLGLSACVKITDKPKKEELETVPGQVSIQNSKIILSYADSPNSYKVHLPLIQGTQILQRAELDSEDNISNIINIPIQPQDGYLIDAQPTPGKKYYYEMGYLLDGEFQTLGSYRIQVPVDLSLNGTISLSENKSWTQYRRIFFEKGTTIFTYTYNLNIEAEELISQESSLETFPVDQESLRLGRSGGTINIKATTAKGSLKVFMRGEPGQHGEAGSSERDCFSGGSHWISMDGTSGKDGGHTGFFYISLKAEHSFQTLITRKAGEPGIGGAGGTRCMGSKTTVDGKNGQSGQEQAACIYDFRGPFCYP